MKKYRRFVTPGCLRSAVLAVGILLSAQEASAADPVPRSYWNVFNFEEESALTAQVVTYSSLTDMFLDTNPTAFFTPTSRGFGPNIIGNGTDGHSYWNVFNVEEENGQSAQFATYSSLADMFLDTNPVDFFTPNSRGLWTKHRR
ncbi:MAG TPA: hypothetical protein VFI91_10450 [Longimicrobiaceae bacterium]|nr:hypothetical protein [Longimicrobiaceae bacterium]